MQGDNRRRDSNIFLHPAALLIAVVATAFFKSTEARALTEEHKAGGEIVVAVPRLEPETVRCLRVRVTKLSLWTPPKMP